FLRSSAVGTSLRSRAVAGGDERVLVPAERFADLASPRFGPNDDRIAFVAAGPARDLADSSQNPVSTLFGPGVASAHDIPWDVWTVKSDGSDLQRVAELGADDASLAWSPDGSQMFVLASAGSFIVDLTGNAVPLRNFQGTGGVAWVAH